ncbi:MAG: EamA family transporter [Legionellales bacterium]|nr:EamA family transporter [Legionellales bacterium]
MIWLWAALLSTFAFGFGAFLLKVAAHRGYHSGPTLLGLYLPGVVLFAIPVFIESAWSIQSTVLLASLLIGAGSIVGNITFLKALMLGPGNLTIPLINTHLILIVVMSITLFGEILTGQMILGISLLLLATSLITYNPTKTQSLVSKWWFVYVVLTILFVFIRNGGLKVTQELSFNNYLILFYSYLGGVLFSVCQIWMHPSSIHACYPAIRLGLITGVFSFLGLYLYAYALETGPASIVAPIYTTYSLVAVMLCAIFYKEKLQMPQKIALGSLLIGLWLLA